MNINPQIYTLVFKLDISILIINFLEIKYRIVSVINVYIYESTRNADFTRFRFKDVSVFQSCSYK